MVQLPPGRLNFSSHCVKPYLDPQIGRDKPPKEEEHTHAMSMMPKRDQSMPKVLPRRKENATDFRESLKVELNGLINNGSFIPIRKDDISDGTRVFWSRLIDKLKRGERGIRKK